MFPIVIAGATRGVGLALARLERERGRLVIALVRPGSNATELRRIGADLIWGDALIRSDLPRLFEGLPAECDVVSTLSGHAADGRRVDDAGNINLVAATMAAGVLGRFLLVRSTACGEKAPYRSKRAIMDFEAAVDAKTNAEEYLRSSNLSWTILHPDDVRSALATGCGMPTKDPGIHAPVTPQDAALLAFRALRNPSTAREAIAAVDIREASNVKALGQFPLIGLPAQQATNMALDTLNS